MADSPRKLIRRASDALRRLNEVLSTHPAALRDLEQTLSPGLVHALHEAAEVTLVANTWLNGGRPDERTLDEVLRGVSTTTTLDVRVYAALMRDRFAPTFALHATVSAVLQRGVTMTRSLPTRRHLALNLLMTQVFTTHSSLAFVAEIGHAADAATLARRILELAARIHYIGAAPDGEPESAQANERADTYLAFLWRELDRDMQASIPAPAREPWEAADARLTALGTKKPATWKDTFIAAGLSDLYDEDYKLLSSIAHGSPLVAPMEHASDVVPLRGAMLVGPALRAANHYAVNAARVWNAAFELLDAEELDALARETSRVPDQR